MDKKQDRKELINKKLPRGVSCMKFCVKTEAF